jgi:hypothetical protein
MNASDFSIALRIRHPSIDPGELSRQLGFEPQHSWKAGEPRRSASGERAEGVYRETYWVGLLPAMPLPLSETQQPQTSIFFALLKMKRAAGFWTRIADEGGTVECLIEVHNGASFSLDLSQALLSLLVHLRIALSVEAHPAVRAAAA